MLLRGMAQLRDSCLLEDGHQELCGEKEAKETRPASEGSGGLKGFRFEAPIIQRAEELSAITEGERAQFRLIGKRIIRAKRNPKFR